MIFFILQLGIKFRIRLRITVFSLFFFYNVRRDNEKAKKETNNLRKVSLLRIWKIIIMKNYVTRII